MFFFVAVLVSILIPINCFEASGVKLFYYTPATSNITELHNTSITSANVDASKHVKIICHGFVASSLVDWYAPLIQAYLAKGHQVIAIDWGQYANSGYYAAVASNYDVGSLIGDYIINLRDTFGVSLDIVHLIGHSLGAHISGFAGKHIYNKTGSKIYRITGLDPAGPSFYDASAANRLDAGDAQFVDVIHTNAGALGLYKSIGTIDFYPDGGVTQNGCSILFVGCDHNIVPTYFIESINSNNFVARKCESYNRYMAGKCFQNEAAIMGESCSAGVSGGDYYLTTNKESPYGRGE